MSNETEFCQCTGPLTITDVDDENEFGYWNVCCSCGKKLEDGYHYYNHYDGEDHEELDFE